MAKANDSGNWVSPNKSCKSEGSSENAGADYNQDRMCGEEARSGRY